MTGSSNLLRIAGAAQLCLALGGVAILALAPPAEGSMLAVPLDGAPRSATLGWATAAGAVPLAEGRWPGSLVIWGRLDRLEAAALRNRSILVRGTPTGCAGVRT